MATLIFVDGVGGHPQTNFAELAPFLEKQGNRIIFTDPNGIKSHNDRIKRVIEAVSHEVTTRKDSKIFLVGFSAGGSAVRIAAEKIWKTNLSANITGIILLSPAMPRGINCMTMTMIMQLFPHIAKILFGREILLSEKQFSALISPINKEMCGNIIKNSIPISGKEMFDLGFWPKKFSGYGFPTLHIYGKQDHWINPKAQVRLSKWLSLSGSEIDSIAFDECGHIPQASEKCGLVRNIIGEWILRK